MNEDAALQQVYEMRARVDQARMSAVRTSRITTGVAAVVCGLGSLGLLASVLLGRAPTQSLGGVVILAVCSALTLRTSLSLRRPEHLAQEGIPAVAIFERVVGSGVRINVSSSTMEGTVSQTRMRFKIEGAERPAYTVDVTDLVPSGAHGRLVAGSRVRAYVDRARPDRVLLDWSAAV
ncbi:MAG: hypothetical protein R3A48_13010 [Polyangiales bacterium]